MPGCVLSEPHPQSAGLAARYTPCAKRRLIHLPKNLSGVFQKGLSRSAYFHSARKALESFEADLLFQILDLAGERGLSHTEPLGRTSAMLLLSNYYKISQMS